MKVSRAWLQTYFDDPLPPAAELAELLTFHAFEIESVAEVGDDHMIEIDVLPNRSSDCLSHRGIARELATLLARPMKCDPLREPIPPYEHPHGLTVRVEDTTLCPRYMAAVVRGVSVGPSPAWLTKRLETVGQRSINNIVDATNYIMLDTGQPLHAFDLAKLLENDAGERVLAVRAAREGERITLLSGDERTLAPRHLVIADGVAEQPLALAGIKGGALAELTPQTVDLVLEAATFNYTSVRTTSRELKLATEASLRFQNEPGATLPPLALRDLITLIGTVGGGVEAGVWDVGEGEGERTSIKVHLATVNSLLGTSLSVPEVEAILVRFEWEFSRADETFAVTPAWERSDVTTPEALIEEIGRVYGYRKIRSLAPAKPLTPPAVNATYQHTETLRRTLAAAGYSEVYGYLFRDRGEVELANALASDKAYLRANLREGLQEALERNAPLAPFLGLDDIKLFEMGTVFREGGVEHLHLALGVRGIRTKQVTLEAMLVRDLARCTEALGVTFDGTVAEEGVTEVDLTRALALAPHPTVYDTPLPWDSTARYTPWSPYPHALRDVAVWVPEGTSPEDVRAVLTTHASELLVRHHLFDTFTKDDRVSYAWHLVFQSSERTLTDADVNPLLERISSAFAERGWVVR